MNFTILSTTRNNETCQLERAQREIYARYIQQTKQLKSKRSFRRKKEDEVRNSVSL